MKIFFEANSENSITPKYRIQAMQQQMQVAGSTTTGTGGGTQTAPVVDAKKDAANDYAATLVSYLESLTDEQKKQKVVITSKDASGKEVKTTPKKADGTDYTVNDVLNDVKSGIGTDKKLKDPQKFLDNFALSQATTFLANGGKDKAGFKTYMAGDDIKDGLFDFLSNVDPTKATNLNAKRKNLTSAISTDDEQKQFDAAKTDYDAAQKDANKSIWDKLKASDNQLFALIGEIGEMIFGKKGASAGGNSKANQQIISNNNISAASALANGGKHTSSGKSYDWDGLTLGSSTVAGLYAAPFFKVTGLIGAAGGFIAGKIFTDPKGAGEALGKVIMSPFTTLVSAGKTIGSIFQKRDKMSETEIDFEHKYEKLGGDLNSDSYKTVKKTLDDRGNQLTNDVLAAVLDHSRAENLNKKEKQLYENIIKLDPTVLSGLTAAYTHDINAACNQSGKGSGKGGR